MNREHSDPDRLELRRVTYSLRPSRNAFLVPPDLTWDEVDTLLQTLCWYWGGPLSLFIPCDGADIDPIFWQLLALYDTDYLHSARPQKAFDAQLLDQLRRRLCPLEPFGKTVHLGGYDSFRLHSSIELPLLFADIPAIDAPLVVWQIDNVPAYLRVCVHEHTGHLSQERLHQLAHPDDVTWTMGAPKDLVNVCVEETQLDGMSALYRSHSIGQRFGTTPKRAAMWALAYTAYDDTGSPLYGGIQPDAPAAVIVGDTLDDYCLFHDLAVLRHHVHWLPKLPQEAVSDEAVLLGALIDALAHRIRYPGTGHRPERVLLFSTSKKTAAMRAARDEMAARLAMSQLDSPGAEGEVGTQTSASVSDEISVGVAGRCEELFTYSIRYLESNNVSSSISQFYGGRAVPELNTPLLKNFDRLSLTPLRLDR